MKRAVVIGASSGIGRQVAQLLAQDGWNVGIAARRIKALEDLKRIAPDRIFTAEIDVTAEEAPRKLLSLINELDGMQLFFYASGIGWQNRDLEAEKELATLETNATGFTRMVGTAFRYFAENAGGHIAVISSIAGTKGLGPAPAYSATKALQNTYIEALEQLAHMRKLNISFTDIRPGFVDTPLLHPAVPSRQASESTFHYPMLISSHFVAKQIIKAIYKKKHVIVVDWRWRIITSLWRYIPRIIWRRIPL